MITWKFEPEKQSEYYEDIKNRAMNGAFDELKFYVLPFMPRMFRNRIVFLPREFNLEKIYSKQKHRLSKIKSRWDSECEWFETELIKYFPKLQSVKISVSPSLYGPVGLFDIKENKIIIMPRYDRNVIATQRLVINALTNYSFFKDQSLTKWEERQDLIAHYQNKIFNKKPTLTMKRIIENSFSGKLAEVSHEYKKELGVTKESKIKPITKLTKNEKCLFDLLLGNKGKIVSFDALANALWKDKSDEKYSEYAITKLIERLKKKLPKYLIHSQRGLGYILVV